MAALDEHTTENGRSGRGTNLHARLNELVNRYHSVSVKVQLLEEPFYVFPRLFVLNLQEEINAIGTP